MRDTKTTARRSHAAHPIARAQETRGEKAAEAAATKDDGLIGTKLRALRLRQNKTLQAVSASTGISVGHLSQLERDLVSPSIKTLHDLSRALGVNISWFFLPQEPSARVEQHIVRKQQRRHISYADGIDDYQLNSQSVRHLGLLYSTFKPGASSGDSPYAHEGEEAGYIVAGRLELWIDGASTVLMAGDSFSFPSSSPHRYCNPGRVDTVVVWAMTPPTY